MPTPKLTEEMVLAAWNAKHSFPTAREAAESIGISQCTLRDRIRAGRKKGWIVDEGVQAATGAAGLSIESAPYGWIKTPPDESGNAYSVFFDNRTEEAEDRLEAIKEAFHDIPKAPPAKPVDVKLPDMLTRYICTDEHWGMLTWGMESETDWDLTKARDTFLHTHRQLVDRAPPSGTALFIDLGDATHANDHKAMTPGSGHILDVDSRYPKVLRAVTQSKIARIEMLLEKHDKVIVAGVPGNHDPDSHHAIMNGLAQRYENHDRVTVQWQASEWWAMEWGDTLIAANHGHRSPPDRAASLIADHYSEMWGRTKWRYLDRGHIHTQTEKMCGGILVRTYAPVIPRDAYAFGSGYTGRRMLQCITCAKHGGERTIDREPIG